MNTVYFRNLIAGNVFGSKTSPGLPAALYLGLSRSTPNESGGNVTEPSGGAYARVKITGLTAPSSGVVKNGSALDFSESTAPWGTCTHWCIFDAATGGNLLMYDQLTGSRNVETGSIVRVKANSMVLDVLNAM